MRGSRSTQQTSGLTVNSLVVFTQTDVSTGSDISLNTSTGQITLAANKTYRVLGQVPNVAVSGSVVRPAFCWYNETTSAYVGSGASYYQPSDAAGFAAGGGLSELVLSTTQSTVISYRILSIGGGSLSGLGGNGDFGLTGSYPWFDIELISGYSALLNGTSGSSGTSGTSGSSGTSGTSGSSGLTFTILNNTATRLVTANGTSGQANAESTLTYDGVSLKLNAQSGDEGGEIFLNKPVTNTSINTGVTIDVYQNRLRIFESGGSARGAYIDLTTQTAGVATNISPNAWLYATRNTNQTIGSGSWSSKDIIFNNQVYSNNITYNTTTGIATLTAGTYRITARLAWSMAANYLVQFSLFDSSNNQLGPTVEQIQPTSGSPNTSDSTFEMIYDAASTIDVKIRTLSTTTALSGEYIRGDLNTQLIIQKI